LKFFASSSGVLRENSLKYPGNPEGFPKNLCKRLKQKQMKNRPQSGIYIRD
jgi:hypothetical protein